MADNSAGSPAGSPAFEKLGLFYLGRRHDLAAGRTLDEPVLYDSRDLVTHAVCIGMTGSGKTGLCLDLIEEAAIDGVPVIAIDPKGDLGNLLLTFPGLSAAEFRPWVNEDDARLAGLDVDAFAAKEAAGWAAGLQSWGQDGARIERLRKSAECTIYTPGSRAGRPVSILSSFSAPSAAERDDTELLAERASGTATSALVLAGVDAPPRSREHSLVAALLTAAWQRGASLDLASLIREVQSPPFDKVGVVDLESFFPAKERFALAMQLNGVLAAPGFEVWLEGDPLDPQTLFYDAAGRPRVSVFSIAHLGDVERMFFVSLLMNQMVGWMRRQSGTTSLRAVLYMDEILGYFPPVANPPSKAPLLTLLKQGRAFGLGVVLATQNPVDLDYKGLANTGTWFLGRLQTERDKARVLDGLEGAAGGLDRAEADRLLSALKKRMFLMHNVHDAEPTVFETRWTLSYLRGPLSRDQIKALTAQRRESSAPARAARAGAVSAARRRPHRPRLPRRAAPSVQSFPPESRNFSCPRMAPRRRCTTSPAFSARRVSASPIVPWVSTPPARSSISPRCPTTRFKWTGPRRRSSTSRPAISCGSRRTTPRSSGRSALPGRRRNTAPGRGVRQVAGAERAHRAAASSRAGRDGEGLENPSATSGSGCSSKGARRATRRSRQCAGSMRRSRGRWPSGCDGRSRQSSGNSSRRPIRRCRPPCRWARRCSVRCSGARQSVSARSGARRPRHGALDGR